MSISRRNFLRFSALGASSLLVPDAVKAVTPAAAKSKKGSANDKINLGFIGLGQQAIHLMNGFITIPDVRIVAACDIYDIKRNRFEQRVNKYYSEKKIKNKLTMYIRYEELLAREDIDAVVIHILQNLLFPAAVGMHLNKAEAVAIGRGHFYRSRAAAAAPVFQSC